MSLAAEIAPGPTQSIQGEEICEVCRQAVIPNAPAVRLEMKGYSTQLASDVRLTLFVAHAPCVLTEQPQTP